MRVLSSLPGGLAALIAAACSGNGDGGSGNQGGGSSILYGGSGNQGGGSSISCSDYEDAPPQVGVTIRVTNARPTPIYLETECSVTYTFVAGGVTHQGQLAPVSSTCGMLKMGNWDCCDCFPSPYDGPQINPAGTWQTQWGGLFYEWTQLPAECLAPGVPLAGCWQVVPAPKGPLQIQVKAYAARTCDAVGCFFTDPVSATADFVFDGNTTVDVTFGP